MCPVCGSTEPLCSSDGGKGHHHLPCLEGLTREQLARLREEEADGRVFVRNASLDVHPETVDF